MELPKYEYINVELDTTGHVAIIKYNRPRSGNSLHPELLSQMLSALRWAEAQTAIRVIIQSGEGRFFCTGMELLDLDTETPMSFAHGSDFHMLNKLLICSEKILIAAVNGPAAGYGVSSLALFDLVYSVPDAYFFTPFVKWGMATEGASSFSFPRLMGHQKAALLCLAGDHVSADKAEKLGLISKILPKEGFFQSVLDIGTRIARSPPSALRTSKALMKQPVLQSLLDANDLECAIIDKERFGSAEYSNAVQQFRIDQAKKQQLKSKI
jgi:peroxisomal 3,2-trans-enoyl-CoA isomerase